MAVSHGARRSTRLERWRAPNRAKIDWGEHGEEVELTSAINLGGEARLGLPTLGGSRRIGAPATLVVRNKRKRRRGEEGNGEGECSGARALST